MYLFLALPISSPWILIPAFWLAIVVLYRMILMPIFCRAMGTNPTLGFIWYCVNVFSRLWHHLDVVGRDIPRDLDLKKGLIVVSNHTGAIDPMIIQSCCPFHIRWMMAQEMMLPSLDWFWKILSIIPLARDGKDTGPTRLAIRFVKEGGVLGIFPEGRIVVPPREIRPFHPGVGLIVARTKAPVLLCWISGTPDTNTMAKSLLTSSRSRVHFIELIDFKGERHAQNITRILRQRIAEVSGWPLNDETQASIDIETEPFPV